MGCNCGGARRAAAARQGGVTFVYDFTAPGETVPVPYGTALEAKRAVRQHGGGEVRRRSVSAPSA